MYVTQACSVHNYHNCVCVGASRLSKIVMIFAWLGRWMYMNQYLESSCTIKADSQNSRVYICVRASTYACVPVCVLVRYVNICGCLFMFVTYVCSHLPFAIVNIQSDLSSATSKFFKNMVLHPCLWKGGSYPMTVWNHFSQADASVCTEFCNFGEVIGR